ASGRAWVVAPDGTGLTCLFDVSDPGAFAWGPRGDRVVLGGLEVRGIGTDAARPPEVLSPGSLSWGRPVGKAIVFTDGSSLKKAPVGTDRIEDITPLENETYQEVVYHPSGLALAFVVEDSTGSAVGL